MPYIGNDLATQFQAFATQTITGDGSTGYTLDRAVANGKELLVYINNVKQEEGSGKSYTASGTTITFSEAVASGDSCYLVYMGSAQQTVTPPAGSLGGYTGNASLDGAVTINESSADVDFRVESDANTHALFVEGSSGSVKLGTTSDPSHGTADSHVLALSGKQNNGSGTLAFIDTAGNSDALLLGDNGSLTINVDSSNATADSSLQIRVDNSEKMRVLSGGGITFNGDTATANALDDYEEGTFTATCSNSVTLTSSKNLLSYTKVGRMVTVGGNIQVDDGQSGAAVIINNLPFTVANLSEDSSYYTGSVRLYSYDVHSSALFVTAVATTNTTTMNFDQIIDDGNSTALGGDNGGSIMFTITYMAA